MSDVGLGPNGRHPSGSGKRLSPLIYAALQLAAHLALPLVLGVMAWRAIRAPGHLRGLSERFGFGPVGPAGAVWIYAASVGETRAASPLIRKLRDNGHPVLLTHLSPAGLDEGWRLFPDDPGITHRYMPLDLFWAVRLFLRRARPAVGAVLELEIWPAMLTEARRAQIPMVLVNGNLLARSIAEKRGLRRHLLRLYAEFTHIFTRTAEYRDRYIQVGVDPGRISVVGELKQDQWVDPAHPAMGMQLRARWDVGHVLMIASSIKEEEALLLPMLDRLLRDDPALGVLWVPRSPQRFDAVAQVMGAAGWPPLRRTALGALMDGPIPPGCRVIVGDSIGEMNAYYPMADLVFVGASLVDMGGHNITEPMVFGKPVLMGPSYYSVAFAADPARAAGAFDSAADAQALGMRIADLFAQPAQLQQMAHAAARLHAQQAGASAATLAGLERLLPPRP